MSKPLGFTFLLLFFYQFSTAQVTIWLENFSGAPPAPGWTQNFTDCDGSGSAMVNNSRFETNDMEGSPCCPTGMTNGGANFNEWTTNPIDIDGYCNVTVSVDYGSIGTFECSPGGPIFACTGNPFDDNGHDQIVFEYSINGGAWIQFFYLCGGGPGTATIAGLSGNTIAVRILPANKSIAEIYWFDNVKVQGSLPPVINAINPVVVCAGATVNVPLTSTPPGATFTWTNDNTAIGLGASGMGSPINFMSAAVTSQEIGTISVNTSLAGCTGPGGTFTVTVNPAPVADDPGDLTVCPGEMVSIPLTGTGGATFNWTNNNTNTGLGASGNGDIGFTANNVASTQTSNVTISPTLNGCPGPATNFLITVSPLPNVNQPNNVIACANTLVTVNFSGAGGAALNWTNDNPAIGLAASGFGNINFNSAAVTAQEIATITVIPTNTAGCDGPPRTFTITINPGSIVDPPGNILVCSGSQLDINFTGTASGYNWINNNTATGIPNSGIGDISVITPVFFTGNEVSNINVTPTGLCPGPPIAFTVTVQPTSQVSPVNDVSVCSGQPVVVNFASQPIGVPPSWSNSNTNIGLGVAGSGNISFTAANVATPQVATISVQSVLANCPGANETFTVTINPGPSMSAIPNVSVCGGAALSVIFSGAGAGATYSWTNSNTAVGLGASGTGNINGTASTPGTAQTATITVTPNSGGCAGPSRTFTITVNAVPTVSDPLNVSVCAGEMVAVNFVGSGANFNWTNTNTNIGLGASGSGNIAFTSPSGVTATEAGTITVTPVTGTCPGSPIDFTITVNALPTLNITSVICAGNLLSYSVTLSTTAPVVTATTGTVSGGPGIFTISTIPAGTNVTITATSATTCTAQQTVNAPNCNCPPVSAPASANNPSICEGESIPALSVTAAPGFEVDWYAGASGGAPLLLNSLSFTPSGSFSVGNYTVYAETRDPATGCISALRTPVILTVNITPIMLTPANIAVCAGSPVAVVFDGTGSSNFNWTNTNANIGLGLSGGGDIFFTTSSALATTETGTITVTPSIGTCSGTPSNFTITINALPTLSVGLIQCAANLLTYSVVISTDAASVTATAGTVSGGAGTFTIDQIPAGTNISVTATSAANCFQQQNITAPNCNCPPVALAGGANNPAICEGAVIPALTVTAGAGLEVNWFSVPSGGIAVLPNATSYTPAGPFTPGMYTFYAETRDPATGCISNARTPVTLTVNAVPNMTTPANVSVCPGEPVTVNFAGTLSPAFSWTNSNPNIGLGTSGMGNIVFNAASNLTMTEVGNITVTPVLGTCPGAPVNFTITVNALPTLVVGTILCAPDLTTYAVTITSNASMLTATVGTVTAGSGSFTISLIPAGTNVTLNATSVNGCSKQQTITAPNCACPPVAAASGANNPSVCTGNPIPPLTVVPAAGLLVDWFAAPTGGTALLANATSFTPAGPLSAGMYTFYAETRDPSTGCISTTRTPVVLTVNATPTMTAPANVSVCSGQPVSVSFSGTAGAIFNWTSSNPAIGLSPTSGTGNISFMSSAGLLFNASSMVSVFPQTGTCPGPLQNFTITVNALPVLALGTVICAPDLLSYSVTVSTNGATVTATAGTVTGSGLNWQINQIPAGTSVTISSTSSATCAAQINVTAPNCNCPAVASPGNPNNPTACQGDVFSPLSVTVNAGLQVNWYATATGGMPLLTNSTTFTPAGPFPIGMQTYYAEAFDPATSCSSPRIPVKITITNGITATTLGITSICAGQNTTLAASGGNTFKWSTGPTTASITITPLTSSTYSVIVSNNNLCADTVSINVTVNLPYNVTINTVTCDPAQAGTLTLGYLTSKGCDSIVTTVTVLDLPNCSPAVLVVSDSVDCSGSADGALSLIPTNGFPPYTYMWSGAGLNGNGQIATTGAFELIEDLPVGDYSITVTGSNGATVILSGSVKAPPPLAISLAAVPVSCFGNNDGAINSTVFGGTLPYQYNWTDGKTTANITGLPPATTYSVTVTDARGCTGIATTALPAPAPFGLTILQLPLQCGDQTISFTPAAVGGTAPYTYLLDGSITADIRLKLAAGEHKITILDDKGCTTDTTVFVVIPLVPVISLPADTSVSLGQILSIAAQTNLPVWDTIIWNPLLDSLGRGTLLQEWQPFTSTAVTVEITDTSGCKATATLRVSVRQGDDIFVPNVFTPNESGRNDFWQIFAGSSVRAVEEVRIYDRWGDAVYLWNDVVPLESWPGWDGNSRGKKATPGVYVYYAWLKLVNGERLLLKGDITLLR